ncbi:MAG: enolase C-terminal domain-like protein, partial [Bradymonadaceae bacterium]
GRHPDRDLERVESVREEIGDEVDLMVDGNGAWSTKPALAYARRFADRGVVWFEEPVSSNNLRSLRQIARRAPAPLEVAAGEYGWTPEYFHRMLEADAVDCLQAYATRCLGITGFLQAADLCDARDMPFSSHTAPTLHLHACCAAPSFRHLEYFYDHVRIEQRFVEGAPEADDGQLVPDWSRPGLGIAPKYSDLDDYRV